MSKNLKNYLENQNMIFCLPIKPNVIDTTKINFFKNNFTSLPDDRALFNIKQINCFVGTNNIGKSRFIKNIFKSFDYKFKKSTDGMTLQNLHENHNKYKQELIRFITSSINILENDKIKLVYLFNIHTANIKYKDIENIIIFERNINELKKFDKFASLLNYFNNIIDIFFINKNYDRYNYLSKKRLYIPILRGARLLEGNTDFYKNRTIKDYNLSAEQIFTGLSIYSDLQEHLLGSYEQRTLVKEFEDFLSHKFFNNKSVSLIPRMGKDVVFIKIGEEEHEIHNLGDGIQALIVILFPLFLRRKEGETWAIFIEEPEAHLHPKWQRLLLDTFVEEFPEFQFFISTHSNIFITHNPDVSVYRLYKKKDIPEVCVSYVDEEKITCLKDLGYTPSDLLQSNYIIWVEGPSDIPYIRFFMDKLQGDEANKLKEGLDYSIMVYGGDNINSVDKETELNNLIPLINPHFTLIMDSDKIMVKNKIQDEKLEKYNNLCVKLGEKNIWRTQKREIENYVPLELFKQGIKKVSALPEDTDIVFLDDNNNFGDRMAYTFAESSLNIKNPKFKRAELEKFSFDFKTGFSTKEEWDNKQKDNFIKMIESIFVKSLRSSGDKTKIANAVVELWDTSKYSIDKEIQGVIKGIITKIKDLKN
jgi:predicted ATPase